ncbi:hypothetical protein Fcan01_13501 [Folsomia candida]|uniref:Uncharacterized protein n=1 Tax=Folsomia candida TaxID=158441 RepID=A0A226E1R4_FOLCA|nr:hypothetical protein Fcan01_13501 [Folsomia candida]
MSNTQGAALQRSKNLHYADLSHPNSNPNSRHLHTAHNLFPVPEKCLTKCLNEELAGSPYITLLPPTNHVQVEKQFLIPGIDMGGYLDEERPSSGGGQSSPSSSSPSMPAGMNGHSRSHGGGGHHHHHRDHHHRDHTHLHQQSSRHGYTSHHQPQRHPPYLSAEAAENFIKAERRSHPSSPLDNCDRESIFSYAYLAANPTFECGNVAGVVGAREQPLTL